MIVFISPISWQDVAPFPAEAVARVSQSLFSPPFCIKINPYPVSLIQKRPR